MEYSPTCLNDGCDRRTAELVRAALGHDTPRVLSYKGLEVLTRERALKAALLRVDLRIKLKKAREPIELGLLGLDGLFFVFGRRPLLWHGLDERIELYDLLPRQRTEEQVL